MLVPAKEQDHQGSTEVSWYPSPNAPSHNATLLLTFRFSSLLDGLYHEIDRLKRQVAAQPQPDSHATSGDDGHKTNTPDDVTTVQSLPSPLNPQPETSADPVDTEASPAISTRPWFDSLNDFKSPVLIGEAADAAFATRFRQVITDPSTPEPSHLLRLNYPSNESIMSLIEANTPWPGPSRAKFLLDAAMKYIGRLYHIVQPQAAAASWEQISRDTSRGTIIMRSRLWALFAIGELYISKSIGVYGFPGLAYFSQASKALGYLDERPEIESVELYLLLVSLLSMLHSDD